MSRRWQLVVVVGLWSATAVGCSSSGTFGLGPPAFPLIPDAMAIRDAAPVPPPGPRELAKILHAPYVVEPGDTLLVQPADLDAPVRLPPDQTVLPDGTIDLGKYGRPVVAAHTVPEIEAIVQAAVKAKEKDPILVNVRLVGRASKVYYVLGEVNAPGAFPLSGRETVLDAVIAAGNLTRRASQENIIVSRPTLPDGCRIVFPVCWHQIVQLGDTTTNYQVLPGDRIYVPSQTLFETLFPRHWQRKHQCAACAGPQVPCFGGPGCGDNLAIPSAARNRPPLPGRDAVCRDGTCPDGSCGPDPVAGPVAIPAPLPPVPAPLPAVPPSVQVETMSGPRPGPFAPVPPPLEAMPMPIPPSLPTSLSNPVVIPPVPGFPPVPGS